MTLNLKQFDKARDILWRYQELIDILDNSQNYKDYSAVIITLIPKNIHKKPQVQYAFIDNPTLPFLVSSFFNTVDTAAEALAAKLAALGVAVDTPDTLAEQIEPELDLEDTVGTVIETGRFPT